MVLVAAGFLGSVAILSLLAWLKVRKRKKLLSATSPFLDCPECGLPSEIVSLVLLYEEEEDMREEKQELYYILACLSGHEPCTVSSQWVEENS